MILLALLALTWIASVLLTCLMTRWYVTVPSTAKQRLANLVRNFGVRLSFAVASAVCFGTALLAMSVASNIHNEPFFTFLAYAGVSAWTLLGVTLFLTLFLTGLDRPKKP